jgi:hypothetical protein
MMTTMCALLGGMPMLAGVRGELRKPLGIAIVGGPGGSQMLTLFTNAVDLPVSGPRAKFLARARVTATRPGFLILALMESGD